MAYLPGIRPKQILFCCTEDRHTGGETPIARMDAVYKSLPERLQKGQKVEVVRYFPGEKRRCLDVRRLRSTCPPWPAVFDTTDKDKIVADSSKDGATVSWWSAGPP